MSALFSWINGIDGAILSAGNQVSTLPVANIADRKVQKAWRSGNATASWFGADLRTATSLGVIGLFGMNIAAADTVRIRLSNVAVGNNELLDTTALASNVAAGYGQYVYVPVAPITARYLRVDINAPSRASQGNFDVGRAWAGPVWTPPINFSLGYGEQFNDGSSVLKAPRSGARFVDEGAVWRSFDMTFDWLDDADRIDALEIDRVCGKRGQLLFVPDTAGDLVRRPLLGALTETSKVIENVAVFPPAYSKSYSIEQDL